MRFAEQDSFAEIAWLRAPFAGLLFERPLDQAVIVRLRMETPAILHEQEHQVRESAREWVQGLIPDQA